MQIWSISWIKLKVLNIILNILNRTQVNRPFPSSKKSHFQNESKCETFVVKMSFICIIIKNHFHINGFALSLTLKVRFFGTRKWPILNDTNTLFFIYFMCMINTDGKQKKLKTGFHRELSPWKDDPLNFSYDTWQLNILVNNERK